MGDQYDWKGNPVVAYNGGAAQNNTNPLATFGNHVVLIFNRVYYDPSYGKTYTDLKDMQKKSIAGFYDMPDLIKKKEMYIMKSGNTLYLYSKVQKPNSSS